MEKFLPDKLSRYLIKNLLKMFLLIFFISFMIVFTINFFEFSGKIQKYSINHFVALRIITYRTLPVLEIIMIFILTLAVNFELIQISERSELTIMYISNYSPWRVLKSIVIFTTIIGFLSITLFNKLSIELYNISEKLFLESRGRSTTTRSLKSKNGVWLNLGLVNEESLIIRSDEIFIDELIFNKVDGLLIDKDGKLIRKISADNMSLINDEVIFSNLLYIEKTELNHHITKSIMITNADNKFIRKQLLNEYEKLKLIPFISLKKLINDHKTIKLNTVKFEATMFNFISKPLYFIFAVCFIFITLRVDQRNSGNTLATLKVILMTIILFVIQSVIAELAVVNLVYPYSNLLFSVFILLFIFKNLIRKIELISFN